MGIIKVIKYSEMKFVIKYKYLWLNGDFWNWFLIVSIVD